MGYPAFRCHDNKNLCRNDDPQKHYSSICSIHQIKQRSSRVEAALSMTR